MATLVLNLFMAVVAVIAFLILPIAGIILALLFGIIAIRASAASRR